MVTLNSEQTVGTLNAQDVKLAVVAGRFNHAIVETLVSGASTLVRQLGGSINEADIYWVPGAWELPVVTKKLLEGGQYHGVIVLGAVIRGSTPHFEAVVNPTVSALQQLSVSYTTPVGLGLLTTNTIEEARERAGTKMGNKGIEATLAVLETISILRHVNT